MAIPCDTDVGVTGKQILVRARAGVRRGLPEGGEQDQGIVTGRRTDWLVDSRVPLNDFEVFPTKTGRVTLRRMKDDEG